MTAHTRVYSVSLCVLASTLLVHFIQVSAFWCVSHACNDVLVMLKVFTSCVLIVSTMKASITLTHGVTFTATQASSRSMNGQS